MLQTLGVLCAFQFLSGRTRFTKPPKKFRSFAWRAGWRIAVAILVLLTFSTQSFALCVCDGQCCHCTPIIIDVSGHGFHLTSAAGGVVFDISGTGHPVQISWTAPGSDNAFLALPASDGLVHGGTELFGNFTPQPESNDPNGFRALAVYDLPANGGNGDGVIDFHDRIFSALRLWIDANHDGISQKEELHTLPSMGVNSISLDYSLSSRRDQYGNVFRYKSEVNPDDPGGSGVGRVAYDVLLIGVVQPPAADTRTLSRHLSGQTEAKLGPAGAAYFSQQRFARRIEPVSTWFVGSRQTSEDLTTVLEAFERTNSIEFKTASIVPIPPSTVGRTK